MKVLSANIKNFKSFKDTGKISFSKHFNVIFGQNNSGKSAFIEALSLRAPNVVHRSALTARFTESAVAGNSSFELLVEFDIEDSQRILGSLQQVALKSNGDHGEIADLNALAEQGGEVCINYQPGVEVSGGLPKNSKPGGTNYLFSNLKHPTGFEISNWSGSSTNGDFGAQLYDGIQRRIYAFRAERLKLGASPASGNSILAPDASNLPEVINRLISANRSRYDLFLKYVVEVFPHITHITAPLQSSNSAQIRVWSHEIGTQREDLAIPLSDSGTGIGQVLAILYAVVCAEGSQIIVIDEPQSFLHPGAVRKLLDILRNNPQHQYFISTHYPLPLLPEDAVLLLSKTGAESVIEVIDQSKREDSARFLNEVGARLSDVFGADRILWVEGKTEEICFPIILRDLAGTRLAGTQILALLHTGDLEGRHAKLIFELYSRLSSGPNLMPAALGFILDPEGRTPQQKSEIETLARGKIKWLPRKMYENYLLDAEAIATVISADLPDDVISSEKALACLLEFGKEQKYFGKSAIPEVGTNDWLAIIDGAKLISDVFLAISEAKLEYNKLRHGQQLTEILIASKSTSIVALTEFLLTIVAPAKNDQGANEAAIRPSA